MTGWIVLGSAAGLLGAAILSYLVLGAAADARSADAARRRSKAIDTFTAVLFSDTPAELDALAVARAVERESLIDVVSGLGVDLGVDGRRQLQSALSTGRIQRLFRRLRRARRWTRRIEAARLCGLLGSGADRRRLLTDGHRAVRITALAALSPEQVGEEAGLVADALLDPDPDVRITAASVLPTGGSAVVASLVAVLEQTSADRDAALLAAARLTDRSLLDVLCRHAGSDHVANRVLAAQALGHQHPAEAEPVLVGLLDDDDPRVRVAAAEALGRMGHHESLVPLRGLLEDPEFTVRRAAERALLGLGPGGGLVLRQQHHRRAELDALNEVQDGGVPLPVSREARTTS